MPQRKHAANRAGKSVNETRASLGFPPLPDDPVVAPSELISHTETELGKIADMANKVQYIMGTLSETLDLLHKGIGDSLTANEVDAVLQLAKSFATGATDNECHTLIHKIMALERTLKKANQ